jgi:hypothetical protein
MKRSKGPGIAFMVMFIAVLSSYLLPSDRAHAQESWCTANPAACVCSDTFQSTTYTNVLSGSNYGQALGDQVGPKPCRMDDPVNQPTSVQWSYGAGGTFASMFKTSSDASILSLLPNRNSQAVPRFLRFAADNDNQTARFGYSPIPLAALGSRRIAMRWYSYHSPNYQWAYEGTCTNGKIAHNSAGYFSYPMMTLTIHGGLTSLYSFNSFSGGGWVWPGHSSFEGFGGGSGPRPASPYSTYNYRGKWTRHEIVVSNPRAGDVGGYDFRYYVKNVTDNGPEVEDVRFSSSCTNCMAGGANYVWDSGIHPTADMKSLHTEFYRAGGCAGWQGWVNLAVASWPTNAGQRIGPAVEVEGGGSPEPADTVPPTVQITSPLNGATVGIYLLNSK